MSTYRYIQYPSAPYETDLLTDFENNIYDALYYRFYKTNKTKYDNYVSQLKSKFINPRNTKAVLNFLKQIANEINDDMN